MSDLDTGFSKVRRMTHMLEFAGQIFKAITDSMSERKHFNVFFKNLNQNDPQHPVMDSSNTTMYDASGMGHKKMQAKLDECNIPNATFTQDATGKTFVAVPKQYTLQANKLFAMESAISANPSLMRVQQRQFIRSLTDNRAKDAVLSPEATSALMDEHTSVIETSGASHIGLELKLKEYGIPFSTNINTENNRYCFFVDSSYKLQVDQINIDLQKQQTELSYDSFMRNNRGKEIIERKGLTDGQVHLVRDQLMGSSLGYNFQEQNDGTYTLRYNAERIKYIEPAVLTALIYSNGLNGRAIEGQSRVIEAAANDARNAVALGQQLVIMDKANPEHALYVDSTGLRDINGTLIVSKQDPQFESRVFASVYQMEMPVIQETEKIDNKADAKKIIEGLATLEEIKAAKESAALANPEQSGVIASQLACIHLEHIDKAQNATTASIINSSIDACYKLANGIEEEGFRMDAKELAAELSIPDAHFWKVKEYIEHVNELSNDERIQFRDAIGKIAEEMQIDLASGNINSRTVRDNDLSKDDMERVLDNVMGIGDGQHSSIEDIGTEEPSLIDNN